jgi:benzoate/toluate 1,2-dioxygenase alpha subunit
MATPDDLAAFNQSQIGFKAELTRWSDMSRGFKNQVVGAEPYAQQLGIEPVSSGTQAEDEGIMIAQHQRWIDLMSAAQTS